MGIINNGKEKKYSVVELKKIMNELRSYILISLHCAGSGHSGGSLSALELVALAYLDIMKHKPKDPNWEDRDRFYFSAGHKAPLWYIVLGYCGYYDIKETAKLRKLNAPFQGHPDRNKLKGIELSGGSLGQGLSASVGDALSARLNGRDYRVFCLMGDGEQQEGQIWEAVMAAAHHKLDNLVAIVDRNRLQIDGWVTDVMDISSIEKKYRAFGWHTIRCNGHNVEQVLNAYKKAETIKGKPTVIVADTVKGKGVSFMEDDAGWHGKAPNREELDKALKELGSYDLPVEEMIKISNIHQKNNEKEIKKIVPKFSKNYWWNQQVDMKVKMSPTRKGFGNALADTKNEKVCALGSDISSSICIDQFYLNKREREKRWFSMGIAEQSGISVAAGFTKGGNIPVFGTYGVFAAGRALDQIRTTVCYGNLNVKIAGAHAGISVGPDGATHQALEEISQIAALPNMHLIVPADEHETKKATEIAIENDGPFYLRYAREATPIISKKDTPFKLGIATIIKYKGKREKNFIDAFETTLSTDTKMDKNEITIIACGPVVPEAMRAIWILDEEFGIKSQVVNMSTVKPLDKKVIIDSALNSKVVLTIEEHQKGGFGNYISGVILSSKKLYGKSPKFSMIGIEDRFGLSGKPWELMQYFGLTSEFIVKKVKEILDS